MQEFEELVPASHIAIIPSGEQHKNFSSAEMIWDMLVTEHASRKSVLVNFGGGMITDLGGFAASVFMRGIKFVNIPTTLLAMVDASVGGKTGINYGHFKNYIGTFSHPAEVIIDTRILSNLPGEELINGWAEVLKHAIIKGGELWHKVSAGIPESFNQSEWARIVEANISVKSDIVNTDATEQGLRKVLNLGHSVGHAIESVLIESSGYIPHGQAVAAGIWIESYIAVKRNILNEQDFYDITNIIQQSFVKAEFPENSTERIIELVKGDKKNHSDRILMALPEKPGKVIYDIEVSAGEVIEALRAYAAN